MPSSERDLIRRLHEAVNKSVRERSESNRRLARLEAEVLELRTRLDAVSRTKGRSAKAASPPRAISSTSADDTE